MMRFFVTADKKAGIFTNHIWQPYWQHGCRSEEVFGGVKEFCPDSPKLARKKLDLHKKLFMSIRAPLFSNQSMLGAIFTRIFRQF